MNSEDWTLTHRDIINDALKALSRERRRTTNLYLETVPWMKNSLIGPDFQNIRARQPSILVFADDDPMANFGHRCRYRFYDAKTHAFLYEVAAQFPPYLDFVPATYKVFHEPVRPRRSKRRRAPAEITPAPPPAPAPRPVPVPAARERYAILFSGSSDRRHLNDLEYCYRMLTERYGFNRANICVLNRDNTRKLRDGTFALNWPQESDPPDQYKIPVPPFNPPPPPPPGLPCFPADRDGFRAACQHIAINLNPEDLVFIHTNGHGGAFDMNLDGQPEDPWLVSHNSKAYYVDKFCEDLAILPQHDSMLIVMQQCYSGHFIDPVIAAKGPAKEQIKAQRLSIACASLDPSYANDECTFDMFMFGWVTAHLDADPYGNPPEKVVDTGGVAGVIEASEAYAYAESVNVAHPLDHPKCEDAPDTATVVSNIPIPSAGDIQLK
jgi:hypothetical protein